MCSTQSNPHLTIIDVGHGSSAVLKDADTIAVFDAGRNGQCLRRYLTDNQITVVDVLIISHADTDHAGGLISVLLDPSINVKRLFINPDPTKKTISHLQLQCAIATARQRGETVVETQVTTSINGRLDTKDVRIEILYPSPEIVVSGVGGRDLRGNPLSSNSMCAAIRLLFRDQPKVLLAGDIDFSCIDYWTENEIDSSANILIYPHHGGLPGTSSPSEIVNFTEQLVQRVDPVYVIFSIHRTRHNLPRRDVLAVLEKSIRAPIFLCTQLPDQLRDIVSFGRNQDLGKKHCVDSGGSRWATEGNIKVTFSDPDHSVEFENNRREDLGHE